MGNLISSIKKFLGNKNTVTIFGVLAGVAVLWVGYIIRVKEATTPIKVPFAKQVINATDEITAEMIGTVEVNSKLLKNSKIIQNKNQLIGYYVNTGTSIPEGALFYESQVVKKEELPNTIFDNIPEGHTIYTLGVDNHTTYGNSIYPGDIIDLFIKTTNEENRIVFGSFIKNIKVLGVRDSSGKDVFGSTVTRTPAELLFSVNDTDYLLLKRASYISGIVIVPVPRNQKYVESGEMKTSEYFTNLINAKSSTTDDNNETE